jgi:hypothetical protein
MGEDLERRVNQFKDGIIEGYQVGWNNGFWNGCGGEKAECGRCLQRALPPGTVILDSTATDLIKIAIEEKEGELLKLKTAAEVTELILQALKNHQGFSIVRIGESEALVLAQEVVLSPTEVLIRGNNIIPLISGVTVPDLEARNLLVASIKKADLVGIPTPVLPNHLPLAYASLKALGVNIRKLNLTNSVINYDLLYEGYFGKILLKKKPLVITVGDTAAALGAALRRDGVEFVGAVTSVSGMRDIDRVMGEVQKLDFDLALVPAGVPSVVICQRIATELGKVALDLGHCANQIISGQAKIWIKD